MCSSDLDRPAQHQLTFAWCAPTFNVVEIDFPLPEFLEANGATSARNKTTNRIPNTMVLKQVQHQLLLRITPKRAMLAETGAVKTNNFVGTLVARNIGPRRSAELPNSSEAPRVGTEKVNPMGERKLSASSKLLARATQGLGQGSRPKSSCQR